VLGGVGSGVGSGKAPGRRVLGGVDFCGETWMVTCWGLVRSETLLVRGVGVGGSRVGSLATMSFGTMEASGGVISSMGVSSCSGVGADRG